MTDTILYTQPNCPYCVMMKTLLDSQQISYQVVDIQQDSTAKTFLKDQGHRTVPQLYANGRHINTADTTSYTGEILNRLINAAYQSNTWLGADSGIEQEI